MLCPSPAIRVKNPKSEFYVGVVKLVVASAVSEDGEEMFPRKWNHEFLDMPVPGS